MRSARCRARYTEVRRAARDELRKGVAQIKIMASGGVASPSDPTWVLQFSEEEIRAVVWEAHSWRTYVMAHAYTPEAIRRCIEYGVRSIEHGNLIDADTAAYAAEQGLEKDDITKISILESITDITPQAVSGCIVYLGQSGNVVPRSP